MKTCMLMKFKSKYTVNVICLFHSKYEAVSIRMYFLSILRNLFNLSIAFENLLHYLVPPFNTMYILKAPIVIT